MVSFEKQLVTKFRQSAELFDLIVAFESCTLPLSQWNQTTFLTIVFWYLYLNPVSESEKLMSRSLRRYQFETGLNLMPPTSLGKIKTPNLFRKINDIINSHKCQKSFVELANMVLELKELK